MDTTFDFNDLFVLDMANNHQGDIDHGLNIIESCGRVVAANGVRAALKFQFRQLDSFIHPAERAITVNAHIPRFLSTALSKNEFRRLADAVRAAGMIRSTKSLWTSSRNSTSKSLKLRAVQRLIGRCWSALPFTIAPLSFPRAVCRFKALMTSSAFSITVEYILH